MRVLSLFDGISCARVALERAGLGVSAYYASEIDKYAISVSSRNYPDIVQLGSVTTINGHSLGAIDLLVGGSPCQDLSISNKNRLGLSGERSGLFWEYVRILNEVKPKYFILENVASMPKDARETISSALGVEPIMINAALVSAQSRKRLFWTNIPGIEQPTDRGILLQDVLDIESFCGIYQPWNNIIHFNKSGIIGTGVGSVGSITNQLVITKPIRVGIIGKGGQHQRIYSTKGKSVTILSSSTKTGLYETQEGFRKLTPIECERLQGLPDNYTHGISDTQRYKALGNAFNVDVIAHILSYIKH